MPGFEKNNFDDDYFSDSSDSSKNKHNKSSTTSSSELSTTDFTGFNLKYNDSEISSKKVPVIPFNFQLIKGDKGRRGEKGKKGVTLSI